MARLKRTSKVLEKADTRLASMKAIEENLDLGNGLTVPAYNNFIVETRSKLETYNRLLSEVDAAAMELKQNEEKLNDFSERMLTGVATRFGKDSQEYEVAGGKRKSERKRPVRKPSPAGTN